MGNYLSRANTGLKTLVGYDEHDELSAAGSSRSPRKRKREFVENLDEDEEEDDSDEGNGASDRSLARDEEEEEEDNDEDNEDEADEDDDEEETAGDIQVNYDTYPPQSSSARVAAAVRSHPMMSNEDEAYISSLFDSPSSSSTSNPIMSIRNILTSSAASAASGADYNMLAARSINQSLGAATTTSIHSPSSLSLTGGGGGGGGGNGTIEISKMRKNKKAKMIISKLRTPYKQKMKSTSQYIYNTLFIRGENSDVVVKALNKEYRLHKIYIMQSPYFQSMFKGAKWRESAESYIEIAIPDQNINEKALFTAFGSFYREDLELIPMEVIHVLACASLFSLDGLIHQCAHVMLEHLNYKTVMKYYDASILYGVQLVTEKALKWLAYNIMTNAEINMSDISSALFEKILASNDLIILQVETDLYTLCKKWLYFQFNRMDESGATHKMDAKGWQKLFNEFFRSRSPQLVSSSSSPLPSTSAAAAADHHSSDDQPGIGSGQGSAAPSVQEHMDAAAAAPAAGKYILNDAKFKKYASIFKRIRLQHILADLSSIKVLTNDAIIPPEWIEPFYKKNWLKTLLIDQDQLSNEFEMSRGEFDKACFRFGRILNDDNTANWRWVGFNYGIDLLVSHRNRTLTLKRNCSTYGMSSHKGLLSNKPTYRLYYVMRCLQLDKISGNCTWLKESELTCLDLNRNEEKFVLSIDSSVDFPIIINLHVCSFPLSLADSSSSAAALTSGQLPVN